MPDQRQIIIEPIVSENKAKGSRNQGNLNSIFSNSPIYTELSDKERLSTFMSLTKGEILNGNGISFFDTRYVGNEKNPVPNLQHVETGGGGLPSSPYTPNLTSPGPGSLNASDQPEYTGELKNIDNISNFGSGLGGLVSPHESSKKISESFSTLGEYLSGESFDGSNGS